MTVSHRGVRLRYDCESHRLPEPLRSCFVELHADAETRAWMDHALEHPQSQATTWLRDVAARIVGIYDANGIVGAYSMRVLGTKQWQTVLSERGSLVSGDGPGSHGRLLDVGAGDGDVTDQLAPLFDEVETTELSAPMARRLRRRGYRCHEVDVSVTSLPEDEPFDVVSLLNVIDRTTHPVSMLERVLGLLRGGGRLLIAVPVPISPVVFVGPSTVDPEELIAAGATCFEDSCASLWETVLCPMGWELELVSRAPYLCRGDSSSPVEVLDDALFLCRRPPRPDGD